MEPAEPAANRDADPAARVISPPLKEIADPARFIPPLTPGERELITVLDASLDPEWRLYIRPHLDADRPLLAALHPTKGGAVWDVIDWNLREFTVERGRWVGTGETPGVFHSPFKFLDQVRDRLYGVYAPRIGEAINADPALRPFVAGMYFSQASTDEARAKASGDPSARDIAVFGYDSLRLRELHRILPQRGGASDFRSEWFDELNAALSHEQTRVGAFDLIDMTRDQRRILNNTPAFTAIDGVVGSGKTIVLVHAAARAAVDGRVLILTYNRTLTNFLRWLVHRVPGKRRTDAITILHFHDLCRRIHDHHREPLPQEAGNRTVWLDRDWPQSAEALLDSRGVPDQLKFSFVLIDEAQDYLETYLRVIAALRPERVMVAYDSAQRLYEGRDTPTPQLLARALGGRSWQPRRLTQAVRLPRGTAEIIREYARRWEVEGMTIEDAEEGILPSDRTVGVLPAGTEAAAAAQTLRVLESWRQEAAFIPRDIAVLVPSVAYGIAFVRLLAEHGMSSNHVFPVRSTGAILDTKDDDRTPWRIATSRKTNFSVDDSRLKVSTVHSFKGWEAQRVIALLPSSGGPGRVARLVYVMLTRSRGDLVLVGDAPAFRLEDLVPPFATEIPLAGDVAVRFSQLYGEARIEQRENDSLH